MKVETGTDQSWKPEFGFANALGALDKLKAYAEHFDKTFMKEQTTA
ncbi:MAG TPA: hypothetical protein VJ952_00950 [Opitutales bacterium]|nr:hypothetical protein [Opitutales bacterium]